MEHYRVIHIFQNSGKRLDEIGWNIGYEPYGVGIDNNKAVWKSAGMHSDVECSKELVSRLH